MNRSEWMACHDVSLMLRFLTGRVSSRRTRLFACAVAKGMKNLPPAITTWIDAVERAADDQRISIPPRPEDSLQGLSELEQICYRTILDVLGQPEALWAVNVILNNAIRAITQLPMDFLAVFGKPINPIPEEKEFHHRTVALLHDLFDDVFRAVPITVGEQANWHELGNLARTIYVERSFHEMPILGDALEDAGCQDEEVLDHCRMPGIHARGCWVLDGIIGKQ